MTAKALLLDIIAKAPNANILSKNIINKVIGCPPHLVGLIIGHQGSSLKKLTAATSCQVSINQCVKGKEVRECEGV